MEEVGVRAVVKELQKFLGDMKQMDSALNGLRPSGSLLQQMFASIGETVTGFGQKIWDVASVTIGVILRDAIEGILSLMGQFIQSIITAGSEFQTLTIRLNGLNLNDVSDSTKSFNQAMTEARDLTKDQMKWLQGLGAATPFNPTAITNVYTLARSYGFADEEARRLTKDTIEYTAGMGLSNDVLELVIRNMGQMVQRGKITSTEMRDLARGSYMPLNDILERIAKNMGITVAELTKQISTPTGIPAQEFIKAYEAMVEEEPRFVGAAGRLSRALIPAANNVKELFTSLLGLNAVKPVFDVLGEKVASLVDEFVSFNEQGDLIYTDKWYALVDAATKLGEALTGVLSEILGLIPTSGILSNALLIGIQSVTDWINAHRTDIVNFFINIGTAIGGVVAWIRDNLIPFFQRISGWVVENWSTIVGFFQALGDIIGTVLGNLFGGAFTQGDILGGILQTIQAFMQYVIANKDAIAAWATTLIKVWLAVEALIMVFNIFIGILIAVGGFLLTVVGGITSFFISIGGLILGIQSAIAIIGTFGTVIIAVVGFIYAAITAMVAGFSAGMLLASAFGKIVIAIRGIDWGGLGRSITTGIANGISSGAGAIVSAAVNAARSAYSAAKGFLGIRSPSTLFMEMGELTMQGMAKGIENMAGLASQTMTNAVSKIAMPAITMPSLIQTVMAQNAGGTTNNNDTKNFNLTVNSGANTEPIVQDFNMMQSLAGV